MSRNSVPSSHGMQHNFALAPTVQLPRSKFDMSFGHKTTFDEGYLIPVMCMEILPGDTINCSLTALARMATPIFPIMDNLYLDTQYFFVPNRLVWNNWVKFCGEQDSTPSDSTDFIIPHTTTPAMGGVATGDLADYLGIPIKVGGVNVNALPFRGYNLIYNLWYRDQNLQDAVTVELDDGPDSYSHYTVLQRGKRHDYYTSCLPWTQKINDGTTVEIPLGTTAPVVRTSNALPWQYFQTGTNTTIGSTPIGSNSGGLMDVYPGGVALSLDPNGGLYTDLSSASAASINQLRLAFQLQVLFERDARGGTRYVELVKAHYGVSDPLADLRLQRPEFLGGGSQMISINPVTQNAPPTATDDSPQGNLAAFGVGAVHGHGFSKSFMEHGYVFCIMSVRADLNYQQGLNRMWTRSTRYDFYWPALAHIGEQAVLNQEIYLQGNGNDILVFGYQERYGEYRYTPGLISGLFRSTATTPLDSWHLAQKFTSLPTLGSTFIVENAPMDRVEAVSDQPDFIVDMFFKIHAARVMPMFGIPMSLDRF